MNVAPDPGVLSTRARPPCASAIDEEGLTPEDLARAHPKGRDRTPTRL